MKSNLLTLTDVLPLTCTQEGTCCFGKNIWLNPWELSTLAGFRGISAEDFRAQFTTCGGIALKMSGLPGTQGRDRQGRAACSQYDQGCSVHPARPLACRLFPLGRQRQNDQVTYLYRGKRFPCLEGCPTVIQRPSRTVAEYLASQEIDAGVAAQDAYLELVQDLAEQALVMLLEQGLAESGDRETLTRWQKLGYLGPEERARQLPEGLLKVLMAPDVPVNAGDPLSFVESHRSALDVALAAVLSDAPSLPELREAACLVMGLALQLAQSVGAEVRPLVDTWILTARANGAR